MKKEIHFDEMQKLWKPGQHPAAKLIYYKMCVMRWLNYKWKFYRHKKPTMLHGKIYNYNYIS